MAPGAFLVSRTFMIWFSFLKLILLLYLNLGEKARADLKKVDLFYCKAPVYSWMYACSSWENSDKAAAKASGSADTWA